MKREEKGGDRLEPDGGTVSSKQEAEAEPHSQPPHWKLWGSPLQTGVREALGKVRPPQGMFEFSGLKNSLQGLSVPAPTPKTLLHPTAQRRRLSPPGWMKLMYRSGQDPLSG